MVSQSDVARYAASNPSTTRLLPTGKLQFTQTGQEFSPITPLAVLEAYAVGRSYRRAVQQRENEGYDFAQHAPHIMPHRFRDERHFLYCMLTGATLPRNREVVEKHVAGRRFRRRVVEVERAKAERNRREVVESEGREKAKARNGGGVGGVNGAGDYVLAGVLSDGGQESGEEAGGEGGGDKEVGASDEEMGEAATWPKKNEGEAEEDVLWTQGRSRALSIAFEEDGDVDDDDEWEAAPRWGKRAGAVGKGIARKKDVLSATVEVPRCGGGSAESVERVAPEGVRAAKRARPEKKVGRKSRRPRQRRRVAGVET